MHDSLITYIKYLNAVVCMFLHKLCLLQYRRLCVPVGVTITTLYQTDNHSSVPPKTWIFPNKMKNMVHFKLSLGRRRLTMDSLSQSLFIR